jgi:hypothetical protein
LRAEKRPLSSRAILAEAHRKGLVPSSLYGKTQDKTLGARISVDIVKHRDRSWFFRTGPGRYFLREFLDDTSVPEKYREPFQARRRIRELLRGPALAIPVAELQRNVPDEKAIAATRFLRLLQRQRQAYWDARIADSAVFVRSFVCVRRGSEVLSYRQGRYRDDRDTFMQKRSIGFSTLVSIKEHTLFNVADMGIVEAGVRATKLDLDIPPVPVDPGDTEEAILHKFIWVTQPHGASAVLAVITYSCPTWFEPARRRLALNDLRWIDTNAGINDFDDFDPWSRVVLHNQHSFKTVFGARIG